MTRPDPIEHEDKRLGFLAALEYDVSPLVPKTEPQEDPDE